MSKKKKPHARPFEASARPKQPLTPTSVAPEKVALNSRLRAWHVLGVAGALGAGIAGWWGMSGSSSDSETPSSSSSSSSGESLPTPADYEKWSSAIELPQSVSLSLSTEAWSEEQKQAYFSVPGVTPEKREKFNHSLDQLKAEFMKDFDQRTDPSGKAEALNAYISSLTQIYKVSIIGKKWEEAMHSKDPVDMYTLQKMTMAHGIWNEIDSAQSIHVAEIESNYDSLSFRYGGKTETLPALRLTHQRTVNELFNAAYSPKYKALVYDPHAIGWVTDKIILPAMERDFHSAGLPTPSMDRSGEVRSTIAHELMHHVFGKIIGDVDSAKNDAIKKRGPVDMGSYVLNQGDYRRVTNRQLHELAAFGFGLMNSTGHEMIPVWAIIRGSDPDYQFVKGMLVQEVAHWPRVDADLRSTLLVGLTQGNLSHAAFTKAFEQVRRTGGIPAISARMTKLAIHLTKRD